MQDSYILLKGIAKTFHRSHGASVTVLKDFALSVRKGEVVSLHGPNGCGKSTILGIIARTVEPDAGLIQIAGKTPHLGEVGFLFQDYASSLFPWITCAENIAFAPRLRGMGRKERLDKGQRVVETLGLEIDLTKFPYEMSGGQQQLIALARALCAAPSAIVMDEPFSSLDTNVREQVRAKVIDILSVQGITAVFVSHNIEDCIMVSDRIVFLTPLPARQFCTMDVELRGRKVERRVYSDEFATVVNNLNQVAQEARTL